MFVKRLSVRNYRCLSAIDLEFEDYTALIGANGVGKSTVLYALRWFFEGGPIGERDLHSLSAIASGSLSGQSNENSQLTMAVLTNEGADESAEEETRAQDISVSVTFGDVTERDRLFLGEFGLHDEPTFTRTWSSGSSRQFVAGCARRGPGFSAVRQAGPAASVKLAYQGLLGDYPDLGLPEVKTQKAILEALDAWEMDPGNNEKLVDDPEADATDWCSNELRECLRFVLIPAASDLAAELGGEAKDSALSQLVGGLVQASVTEVRDAWETKNAKSLADLDAAVRKKISDATSDHADRVNAHLKSMLPAASVRIQPAVPTSVPPRVSAQLTTEVVVDGRSHDVSRQGHGIQRTVMIAMLQALVPEGAQEGEPGPAYIVAVEEPEIYQHPVKARHLARALWTLAHSERSQVLLATHSPYFVRPDHFAGLRRLVMDAGKSKILAAAVPDIATSCGIQGDAVARRLEKEIPRTFSEGFFAEAAVLVEGDTDKVVLETIAERLGRPLDAAGIAVLSVEGKASMRLASELLERLGTPVYLVVDADYRAAERKYPSDSVKQAEAHRSHRQASDAILGWMLPNCTPVDGGSAPSFGGATVVTDRMMWLHDDLESELDLWVGFTAALAGVPRSKNVAAYRAAASTGDLGSLPQSFRDAVDAIIAVKGA